MDFFDDYFRPHSTDSFTHRKMILSLADRSNKAQKVKVLPIAGKDPDALRSELIKVITVQFCYFGAFLIVVANIIALAIVH